MSDIDHAAEALRLLALHPVGNAADGSWATSIAAEAQVHATLALVEATEKVAEQARIANLLALTAKYGPDVPSTVFEQYVEIRRGLGL